MLLSTDKQELFNLALNGIRTQGKPGWDETSENCSYHNVDDNCKCGVGHCLTPEALPHAADVNDDVHGLIHDVKEFVDVDYEDELIDFLQDLQTAHDDSINHSRHVQREATFMEAFEESMARLAHNYSLTYSPI